MMEQKAIDSKNDVTFYRHEHFIILDAIKVVYVTWIAKLKDETIYITHCAEHIDNIPENYMMGKLFNEIIDREIKIDSDEIRRQIYASKN